MMLEKMLMAATSDGYSPNAVKFDGANDYLTKASLTGIADSKSGIISTWVRVDGAGSGTTNCIIQGYSIDLTYTIDGVFAVSAYNAAVAVILDIRTSLTKATKSAKWLHILASWDLAAGTSNIYVNDVSDQSVVTRTNDTIDYDRVANPSWGVGCNYTGASLRMNGALAEFYFAPGQYLDLSSSANRRKFIDASGLPVSLGSDGSAPTGSQPAIYLKGDSSAFGTNSGSGGNFTVNGTLEKASTTPATTPAWNAVDFDGSSDYLSKAANLSGVSSTKSFIFSAWVRRDASGTYVLSATPGDKIEVYFSVTRIQIAGRNTTSNILNILTDLLYVEGSPAWIHILVSVDLAAGSRLIYVNGAAPSLTTNTYTNDSFDLTGASAWAVGAYTSGTSKFSGAIAELYFAPNQYLDLSVQANREKFILNGAPVSLGSDGSLPTGTSPAIYLPNRAALVGTNAGTGGNFTINGAPKDANSTPLYYYAEPVKFDGTNDYLTRGADLTGIADGKAGTISFWLRVDGGDGAAQYLFSNYDGGTGAASIAIIRNSSNKIQVVGRNAAGTARLNISSSNSYTASAIWVHVLVSFNLATTTAYIYINNASDIAGSPTIVDDTLNFSAATTPNWSAGAFPDGTSKATAALADLWFNTTYIDISQASNRAKFIDQTTLRPVSLGAKGELPTGSQPLLYLGRDFSNFQTNLGSGGNFTVTGALTRGTTSPSDVRS